MDSLEHIRVAWPLPTLEFEHEGVRGYLFDGGTVLWCGTYLLRHEAPLDMQQTIALEVSKWLNKRTARPSSLTGST